MTRCPAASHFIITRVSSQSSSWRSNVITIILPTLTNYYVHILKDTISICPNKEMFFLVAAILKFKMAASFCLPDQKCFCGCAKHLKMDYCLKKGLDLHSSVLLLQFSFKIGVILMLAAILNLSMATYIFSFLRPIYFILFSSRKIGRSL